MACLVRGDTTNEGISRKRVIINCLKIQYVAIDLPRCLTYMVNRMEFSLVSKHQDLVFEPLHIRSLEGTIFSNCDFCALKAIFPGHLENLASWFRIRTTRSISCQVVIVGSHVWK
ncbi:uncharacterized protein TrAtP1_012102 [Trichoderma atroviride]|uniref:uncharacterized protein n=1 Tax=Hypocrea atroviridis TaxID=63577 RepID=UPI00333391C4|nr:hypothetical protein TrAtP1_012102 [Trichoderma atroviride]